MAPGDALDGFTESAFTHSDETKRLWRAGTGPGVIIIQESPGLHPGVIDFGRRVVDAGFTVMMPSLFGKPGKQFSFPYAIRSLAMGCVSHEFATYALDKTSPVTVWLRALASAVHTECGGAGVGVVGMCFTGGFALGMMVDGATQAPVLSQPSLPLGPGKRRKAVGISDDDLDIVKRRVAEGACVLGLRFSADRLSPAERFETLRRELGEGFIAVEIDSSPGNLHGIKSRAHSVLTIDLVDEPDHPTRQALDRGVRFLRDRLTADV